MSEVVIITFLSMWSGANGKHVDDLHIVEPSLLTTQLDQILQEMLRLTTAGTEQHPAATANLKQCITCESTTLSISASPVSCNRHGFIIPGGT